MKGREGKAGGGGEASQARQAYLTHFQASMRGDPGEVTMLLKDFGDTQVGERPLQVIVTRDGEPGQGHVYDPGEMQVTGEHRGLLAFLARPQGR